MLAIGIKYIECNEDNMSYTKEYYEKNKEQIRERQRIYDKLHSAQISKRRHKFRVEHKEELKARGLILKRRVLAHYGPDGNAKCSWPGCNWVDLSALSIDHINGGGTKQRQKTGRGGIKFYAWLEKEEYPMGYQTLCMNHQFVKKMIEEKK